MNVETLAEALPKQQARVREVLSHYEETQHLYGGRVNCSFAIIMIRDSLAKAEKAAASGDVVAMLAAYEDLKGIE